MYSVLVPRHKHSPVRLIQKNGFIFSPLTSVQGTYEKRNSASHSEVPNIHVVTYHGIDHSLPCTNYLYKLEINQNGNLEVSFQHIETLWKAGGFT